MHVCVRYLYDNIFLEHFRNRYWYSTTILARLNYHLHRATAAPFEFAFFRFS